jgi:hypothetical protein
MRLNKLWLSEGGGCVVGVRAGYICYMLCLMFSGFYLWVYEMLNLFVLVYRGSDGDVGKQHSS